MDFGVIHSKSGKGDFEGPGCTLSVSFEGSSYPHHTGTVSLPCHCGSQTFVCPGQKEVFRLPHRYLSIFPQL